MELLPIYEQQLLGASIFVFCLFGAFWFGVSAIDTIIARKEADDGRS